ncbi:MAG TPA: hypothetical protein PK079_22285 [Leptospiraceae bacterium]|nr:hypothetical protein [Leptospiraceae bacterium]HMW08449.1 hypothetical protein [Leptospiraceae bacterium]HMX33883.1 hypothetical protein [Leptospiraceae bacterium]HMY34196.1 hypothetical protein [Leptospiraceae bacterium]HMZ66414.1 hypothetical protein [Leptospiraceae bacterium]
MKPSAKKAIQKNTKKTVPKRTAKKPTPKKEIIQTDIKPLPIKKFPGLGINVVLKHTDESSMKTYIHYLKELRVEWVRLEFNYYDALPDSVMDFFVEELRKADIKILGLLTGLVPGNFINCMIPSLRFKSPIDTLEDYKEFCEKLGTRYIKQITSWEIWNEPNTLRFWIRNPDPIEYVQLAASTAPILKRINSKNKIVFGGLMGDDLRVVAPFQKINFIQECIDGGIDPYIDVYNFHPYDPICYFAKKPANVYFPTIAGVIDSFLHKYRAVRKPFIISEIGVCPLWLKITQTEIGQLYKEIYLHSISKRVDCYFWVLTDFKGPEYSRWNPETAFGLVTWDLKEKEMYKSFVTEMKKL